MGQLCALVRQARTFVQRPCSTVSRRLTSVQSGRDYVQGSIDGGDKRYCIVMFVSLLSVMPNRAFGE